MKYRMSGVLLALGLSITGCADAMAGQAEPTSSQAVDQVHSDPIEAFKQEAEKNGLTLSDEKEDDEATAFLLNDVKADDTAAGAIWTFTDENLAISRWNSIQEQVEDAGFGIQTQQSSAGGSINIYYNADLDLYDLFVMNADNTTVYSVLYCPGIMLSAVKDTFHSLGLSQ